MKKMIFMFCALFLPALSFAQVEKDSAMVELVKLNADLEVGQEFLFGGTEVRFLEVISDSRCPRQVTCIWPGEAKVLFGIKLNGKYFEKEVVVSGTGAELQLANDFLMQVSHLRPYPETGKGIAPEDYSLRFAATLPKEN